MKLFGNLQRGAASIGQGFASIGQGLVDIMGAVFSSTTTETRQTHYTFTNNKESFSFRRDKASLNEDWGKVGAHLDAAMDEVSKSMDRASEHLDAALKEARAAAKKRT